MIKIKDEFLKTISGGGLGSWDINTLGPDQTKAINDSGYVVLCETEGGRTFGSNLTVLIKDSDDYNTLKRKGLLKSIGKTNNMTCVVVDLDRWKRFMFHQIREVDILAGTNRNKAVYRPVPLFIESY